MSVQAVFCYFSMNCILAFLVGLAHGDLCCVEAWPVILVLGRIVNTLIVKIPDNWRLYALQMSSYMYITIYNELSVNLGLSSLLRRFR